MHDSPTMNNECIFGRNPILEALRTQQPLEKIFIQHGSHGNTIEQIRFLAKHNGIVCTEISHHRLRELSEGNETQGVIALRSAKQFVEVDDILNVAKTKGEMPFVLLLDEIEDPHNLGAIIRTAECCGVHGIIVPKHHSASFTSVVAKSSAGAIEHVNIAKVTNIVFTIDKLKEQGLWIIGTDEKAVKEFSNCDFLAPVAIIVGNEGKGVRRLVKEHCDELLHIPLQGKISSLNASVAAGIILYEVVRKRKCSNHKDA